MNIGFLDLVAIYLLPVVIFFLATAVFLLSVYVVVRFDLFHLDFSYDVLMGLKHRKKAFSLANVSLLLLFDNGMQATLLYRISRYMHVKGLVSLALVLNKVSKTLTNIDVSPTAKIGKGLSLWHGTSIVIAQYAEIGERCVVRQGCTVSGFGKVRVGNDVAFSHGSFVIEGNPEPILIEDGCVIAANAVVTKSVPPNHVAAGVPAHALTKRPGTEVKGLIFDLDGVLVDSDELSLATLCHVLDEMGYSRRPRMNYGRSRERIPVPALLRRIFKEKDLAKAERIFNDRFKQLAGAQATAREGVRETLKGLKDMGIKVGSLSCHYRSAAQGVLEACGLSGYVDTLKGADEIGEWKPHPRVLTEVMSDMKVRKENVVYVGCSTMDLRTGSTAAVRVILVPLGPDPRGRLIQSLPRLTDNVVLDGIGSIPAFLQSLSGETVYSEDLCL